MDSLASLGVDARVDLLAAVQLVAPKRLQINGLGVDIGGILGGVHLARDLGEMPVQPLEVYLRSPSIQHLLTVPKLYRLERRRRIRQQHTTNFET